jgi:glycosyltransferase involved in cell wall biosynthesis
VASNIPGLNEIVKDRETGLLFKAESTESLAQKIVEAITNPYLANFLVQRGKEFVKGYLPSGDLLRKYLDFYGLQEHEKR